MRPRPACGRRPLRQVPWSRSCRESCRPSCSRPLSRSPPREGVRPGPRGQRSWPVMILMHSGSRTPAAPPEADTVAINRQLADALGARPGDPIVLRITKVGDVPADSPLGRRTADSWSRRLRVAEVLPAAGLGEFSLRPTQVTGALAVTSLATAQAMLRRSELPANVLLAVTGTSADDSGDGFQGPRIHGWRCRGCLAGGAQALARRPRTRLRQAGRQRRVEAEFPATPAPARGRPGG